MTQLAQATARPWPGQLSPASSSLLGLYSSVQIRAGGRTGPGYLFPNRLGGMTSGSPAPLGVVPIVYGKGKVSFKLSILS